TTGVVFEVPGMVGFALVLLIFYHHQSATVVFHSSYLGSGFTGGAFLAAMFMSLFVIYGFDTASTLAEETRNPRSMAPKAVLASVIGAFVIGAIFLWGVLIAAPNIADEAKGLATSPGTIIGDVMTQAGTTLYLLVVSAAIFVCCMAILTSTIRLAFGMARDDQLPFSGTMAKV